MKIDPELHSQLIRAVLQAQEFVDDALDRRPDVLECPLERLLGPGKHPECSAA